jgi:regulator of RNase E activity RraA
MVGFRLNVAGIAGVVIDGPVTDTDELREYGFPVFHKGVVATTTRIFAPEGELNVPVSVGGCEISPGNIVIGDSDGLFVGELDWLAKHIDDLLAKQEFEGPAKERMLAGDQIAVMSGALNLIEQLGVTV